MKFKHRLGWKDGSIDVGGTAYPIEEDGTFVVPKNTPAEVLERLKTAGHKPVDVEAYKKVVKAPPVSVEEPKTDAPTPPAPAEKPPQPAPLQPKASPPKTEEKPAETPLTPRSLLQSIEGVSTTEADAILNHYPSLPAVVDAGEKDLAKNVKGIGPKTAEKIVKAVRAHIEKLAG